MTWHKGEKQEEGVEMGRTDDGKEGVENERGE